MNAYEQLEAVFNKISHLNHIKNFMIWDEAVMMPPGGGSARATALATLNAIRHETLIDPKNLELLEEARSISTLTDWQKPNLKWMEKQHHNNTSLPTDLVKKITASSVETEQAWRKMRAGNDWKSFAPYLEKTFNLVKESATIRADTFQISAYDVLIDEYAPSMSQAFIDPIFASLKKELPPLIKEIIEKQKSNEVQVPQGPFDIAKQKQLGIELVRAIGFDLNHGRLDTSHHPFCGGVPEDIRMTTRYREDEFSSALLGICHETGHAMYEQHLPEEWLHQPVGRALGMAVHESQSLIIEMQACRTREFMEFLSKKLTEHLGEDSSFDPENLHRLHIKVEPSLIRVDADEVTYPLHVILRYEIEKALFDGSLKVNDLPDAWDAKMTKYLGLSTKDNYKNGVMQDVHWPSGTFGYFPAYTLGSLMAAQFFSSAEKANPDLKNYLVQGDFNLLTKWLNKNIHEKGSLLNNEELLIQATGEKLNPQHFLNHVRSRYL